MDPVGAIPWVGAVAGAACVHFQPAVKYALHDLRQFNMRQASKRVHCAKYGVCVMYIGVTCQRGRVAAVRQADSKQRAQRAASWHLEGACAQQAHSQQLTAQAPLEHRVRRPQLCTEGAAAGEVCYALAQLVSLPAPPRPLPPHHVWQAASQRGVGHVQLLQGGVLGVACRRVR